MINYRFYRKVIPDINDIVIVRIYGTTEHGYNVKLLEYDELEGFLSLTQLSKTKSRKKKIVKIDDEIAVTVLRIPSSEMIEVSKRNMIEIEAKKSLDNYKIMHKLNRLGKEIYYLHTDYCNKQSKQNDITIEMIFENTFWKFYELNDTVAREKLFKLILSDIHCLFTNDFFPEETKSYMIDNLNSRISKSNMITEKQFDLYALCQDGVNVLKNILDFNDDKISILIIAPPKYSLRVNGNSLIDCETLTNDIMEQIKNKNTTNNSIFRDTFKIKIIKDYDVDIKYLPNNIISNMLLV